MSDGYLPIKGRDIGDVHIGKDVYYNSSRDGVIYGKIIKEDKGRNPQYFVSGTHYNVANLRQIYVKKDDNELQNSSQPTSGDSSSVAEPVETTVSVVEPIVELIVEPVVAQPTNDNPTKNCKYVRVDKISKEHLGKTMVYFDYHKNKYQDTVTIDPKNPNKFLVNETDANSNDKYYKYIEMCDDTPIVIGKAPGEYFVLYNADYLNNYVGKEAVCLDYKTNIIQRGLITQVITSTTRYIYYINGETISYDRNYNTQLFKETGTILIKNDVSTTGGRKPCSRKVNNKRRRTIKKSNSRKNEKLIRKKHK